MRHLPVPSPAALARLFAAGILLVSAQAQAPFLRELREAVPPGYVPLAYGDLNGDGAQDLVTAKGVLFNAGGGRFLPPTAPLPLPAFSAGFTGPEVAAAGDFDGDGDLDVFVHPRGSGPAPWQPAVLENVGGGVLAMGGAVLPTYPAPGGSGSCDQSLNPPVVGDFDADGRADLILSREDIYCSPQLYLWRGAVGPGFAAAALPGAPLGRAMSAGDYDGDGDTDLLALAPFATFNGAFVGVMILGNDGSGNLTNAYVSNPIPSSAGYAYYSAAIADFDGDGILDLAAVERFGLPFNQMRLDFFRGTGPLSFAAPTFGASFPHNLNARVWAVDADGDGASDAAFFVPDVAVPAGLPNSGTIYFYSATSAGFSTVPLLTRPMYVPYRFPVGDADGNGANDLMYHERNGHVRILFSRAGVLMDAPPGAPQRAFGFGERAQLTDVDGDGDLDVVDPSLFSATSFGWREALNDGFGTFATGDLRTGTASGQGRVAFVDWDGDGDRDAFVGEHYAFGTPSRVHLRGTGPTATTSIVGPSGAEVTGITVVDLDGDGDEDLLTTARTAAGPSTRALARYENLGGGAWTGPTTIDSGHTSHAAAVGDFDGDGDLDVVVANQAVAGAPDYCRFAQRTPGGWALSTLTPNVTGTHVAAGDLDGDGDLDLVIPPATLLNNGSGSFVAGPVLGAVSTNVPPLKLSDLNGDGVLDLCAAQSYRLGLGGGAFAAAVAWAAWVGGAQVPFFAYNGVGDLDGDADQDVLLLDCRVLTNVGTQLARGAWAVPDRTATLELYGPPGAPVDLFAAPQLATNPLALPAFGVVRLDLASIVYFGSGALDGAGRFDVPIAVPNVPAFVGLSLHWQAVLPSVPRLTNAETTTVLAP